jgi:hypothetical protein
MRSCSIRGVPRTIQIINLIGHLISFILLIDPKDMISPSGRENKSVNTNNLIVPRNPSRRDSVTVKNMSDRKLL